MANVNDLRDQDFKCESLKKHIKEPIKEYIKACPACGKEVIRYTYQVIGIPYGDLNFIGGRPGDPYIETKKTSIFCSGCGILFYEVPEDLKVALAKDIE